jgi:hypothetical protein
VGWPRSLRANARRSVRPRPPRLGTALYLRWECCSPSLTVEDAAFDFEIQHGDNRETAISSPAWTWNAAWVSGLLLQDGLHKMERNESPPKLRDPPPKPLVIPPPVKPRLKLGAAWNNRPCGGCEAASRSSLKRSATEALRAAVAWHCGPVPELGARPSALESVPARLAKGTMSGKRTVPSKSRKIRSRGR